MGQLEKLESQMDRLYWEPQLQGSRFVVVNSETGEVVNDANGYGFKTEEKCKSFIRMMQKQVGIEVDQEVVERVNKLHQPRVVNVSKGLLQEICKKINENLRLTDSPLPIEEIEVYGITLKPLF